MEEIRKVVEIVAPSSAASLVVLLLYHFALSLSGFSGHPVIPGVEPKSKWLVMRVYFYPFAFAFIFVIFSASLIQFSALPFLKLTRALFYIALLLFYLSGCRILLNLMSVPLPARVVILIISFLLPFLPILFLSPLGSVFSKPTDIISNEGLYFGALFILWASLFFFCIILWLIFDFLLLFSPRVKEKVWNWKFVNARRNWMVLLSVLPVFGNLTLPLEAFAFLSCRSQDLTLESLLKCAGNASDKAAMTLSDALITSIAIFVFALLQYVSFSAYEPQPVRKTEFSVKDSSKLETKGKWHFVVTTQEGFLLSKVDNVDNNDVPSRNKLTIVPFSEVVRLEIEVIERRQNETSFRQRMQDLSRRLHQARERFAGRRSQGSQGSASPEGRL